MKVYGRQNWFYLFVAMLAARGSLNNTADAHFDVQFSKYCFHKNLVVKPIASLCSVWANLTCFEFYSYFLWCSTISYASKMILLCLCKVSIKKYDKQKGTLILTLALLVGCSWFIVKFNKYKRVPDKVKWQIQVK